jgi:hypothetical protein
VSLYFLNFATTQNISSSFLNSKEVFPEPLESSIALGGAKRNAELQGMQNLQMSQSINDAM